jgi:tRNA threonylcarbamoyladenosine biosynthesis protein TsaE
MQRILQSADETVEFGRNVGKLISAPVMFLLEGSLGSGKTTFVRGLIAGLDAQDIVTSPTYLVAKEHLDARIHAVHLDIFRINDYARFVELGLEEYFDGSWVIACEWADKLAELSALDAIILRFSFAGDYTRTVDSMVNGTVAQSALVDLLLGRRTE